MQLVWNSTGEDKIQTNPNGLLSSVKPGIIILAKSEHGHGNIMKKIEGQKSFITKRTVSLEPASQRPGKPE